MTLPAWKQYQEDAAQFFRELGFDARTDEVIEGARGKHDVDVAVRTRRAGVDQLWIVECKSWRRSVPKERVLVLAGVVTDVGADRGLLLSESGFQAGALRVAGSANITLTSLSDLRENAAEEVAQVAVIAALRRAVTLNERLSALTITERTQRGKTRSTQIRGLPGVDFRALDIVFARLGCVETGLTQATAESFPALMDIGPDNSGVVARTTQEATRHSGQVLDWAETQIQEQERRAAEHRA